MNALKLAVPATTFVVGFNLGIKALKRYCKEELKIDLAAARRLRQAGFGPENFRMESITLDDVRAITNTAERLGQLFDRPTFAGAGEFDTSEGKEDAEQFFEFSRKIAAAVRPRPASSEG